ncbi:apolipoprotein acyltransferase [Meridianimarinicoccus aquatilis]|uniref:Apolipoprotein acyltransferase n=1 Tax=Meridianimarinicoccus aquatilis TaxID=2552766 RepID=A0A4V3BCJ5_9RHOB|nr:apolipoprotein acyltransferase [Fluviibacterium aquatile]QIE42104.1 apolipoprotein acyltransferase [Rhodobacteraceae bacterium SC52]TDL90979.1 apolipoprotein acyltransferase [Fluviibacterium aquatile]
MIVIVVGLIGAVYGGLLAKRRKGKPADIAQYAAGYGLAFAIVGLFAVVLLNRV